VHVFERVLLLLMVSLAVPPFPSVTVTVTGTDPGVVGHVKTVCRSDGFANVPVGALHL
jgi:hypothetical protein